MSIEERAWPVVSGGLALEARLHDGEDSLAAVVMHPHPQYGGDMHNHVVVAVCEALASVGATTLRFNFRGVGQSEGAFDDGRGEAEDGRAAIASLRAHAPSAKLMVIGYSFGAVIAVAVAEAAEPAALVLISPPLTMSSLDGVAVGLRTLVVSGDHDAISPAAAVKALASASVTARVVPGVDHGWWPGIDTLVGELITFARLV